MSTLLLSQFYVLDLETLGTMDDAVIMQIGMVDVRWSPEGWFVSRVFEERVDIDTQRDRAVNRGTLSWWREQPQEVWDHVSSGSNPLSRALASAGRFMSDDPNRLRKTVWGMPFDFAKFKNAALGGSMNWSFPNPHSGATYVESAPWVPFYERDIRTGRMLRHKADINIPSTIETLLSGRAAHDAVWDCVKMAKTAAGAIEASLCLEYGVPRVSQHLTNELQEVMADG